MEKSIVDRKALAAALLGCEPEELLGFRDEGLSGVVLIAPDGRKLRYPEELLRRAQAWLIEESDERISVQPGLYQTRLPAAGDGGMANSVRPESRPTKKPKKGKHT